MQAVMLHLQLSVSEKVQGFTPSMALHGQAQCRQVDKPSL